MSVPFNTIKCSDCEYSSWLLGRNGWKYYLLPNEDKLTINSVWGWCYVCKTVCAIECLPTEQSINERLHNDKIALSDIKNTGVLNRLLQLLGKDGFQIKQLMDRISVTNNWLNFLDKRKSPARCLVCSSANIKPLDLPVIEENKGFMINDFKHPDCDGTLWLRQNDFWLNTRYTPKSYDTEGIFIEETETNNF